MHADHLLVFLKAPRPGLVKSRLAQTIGAEAAAQAYQVLVEALLDQLASLPEVELRFAPDDAQSEIIPWQRQPNWELFPQGGEDLGGRLQRAFAESFARGAHRVAAIGSDCPTVTVADIEAAWAGLKRHDLVLGPATDGGYWLIGLNRPQPALFDDIPWSSEFVFGKTLEKAQVLGLRVHLLREQTDVDTQNEWLAFLASRPQAIR